MQEQNEQNIVIVKDFEFAPVRLEIHVGETVLWKFEGPTPHTSTSEASSEIQWDSGLHSPGQSFSFTFDKVGEFPFFCIPHPFMKGTIVVQDSNASFFSENGTLRVETQLICREWMNNLTELAINQTINSAGTQ